MSLRNIVQTGMVILYPVVAHRERDGELLHSFMLISQKPHHWIENIHQNKPV